MKEELTVIDPSEFGIEKETAASIEQAFAPAIAKRNELAKTFEVIIAKEMTPELCEEAKEFDKLLIQTEKEIAAIHKTQKNFSLQYGRLCDAWKNKETEPVKQMREPIGKIKKHFELIEAERVAKLHEARKAELDAVGFEGDLNLGELSETVYAGILQGAKLSYEKAQEDARIAEEEAKEAARLEAIKQDRRLRWSKYEDLLEDEGLTADKLLALDDDSFDAKMVYLSGVRDIKNEEAAAAKAEVARLAEELAEKKKVEREAKEAQAKLDAEAKAREAKIQAELDAERKAKLDAELAEKARLEKEAEEAAKLAKAPDKEKLTKWINDLVLPTPSVQNAVSGDIQIKFAGFKKWALKEIEKI
jgi:hypothetical protein